MKLNTPYPEDVNTANPTNCLSLVTEYLEEEEAGAMTETMEQYISKTRTNYGSGVARPKIKEKDSFELKGQFIKELRENAFSGLDNEDVNEHIKKVLEILRNEPTGLIKTWEDLKTKFLNKYCPPGRTAKKMEEINNFQQEPDETLYQAWERFKELLIKCPQHYLTKIQEKRSYGPQFLEAYSKVSHINESIPQKEKDPGSFTLPCFINNVCFYNALVNLGASVSVMPLLTYLKLGLGELAHTKLTVELADGIRKINLRVGEEKIIFKSVKPVSSLIKRVYMLSLRERMELDLEVRLIGETLVLNRSLDPFLEDYIELNDLNEPFKLRRNQGDDLMPTNEEGDVIKEFRTRDEDLDTRIDDYPSYCNDDKKIRIDYAHNLKDNVVGALMNVPIFVGTFSVVTDFTVLEDMDAYRDEGMGDVICWD
ncbi:putative reverse transcriptase domain-containing protein [Tanacetum coccineum]|uniref:Reverse transcriptase domain-containing protein n=1 Tax=Tanacetum coccineum TaxID=301880 RepID=A0ABQ5D9C1_9ASTR